MIKYLAIALAMPLCLFFPARGNTEVLEFDLVKENAIAKNEQNIKQYLMELTILQIEEHEKYLRQKIYGTKSFLDELNDLEKTLEIVADKCDYSKIKTLEALVDAQKICAQDTANYELLLKELKTNMLKKL